VAEDSETGKLYTGVNRICHYLGMNKSQKGNQIQKVKKDILLKQGCRMFDEGIFEENNKTWGIELNYIAIWLSKINASSLEREQYERVIKLLNVCLSDEFNEIKIPLKTYQWEGELRDEIYKLGYFDKYKIIDKEVVYKFGRVDLLAKDVDGKLTVIELKKDKNYNDTIVQCKKYIDGFINELNKHIKVVICTLDDDGEFIKKVKEENFECYKYERKLFLKRVA
jgi:hypothetical protein